MFIYSTKKLVLLMSCIYFLDLMHFHLWSWPNMIEVIRHLRLHACAFWRVNQWPNYCSENLFILFLCAIGKKDHQLNFLLLLKLFSFFIYWCIRRNIYMCWPVGDFPTIVQIWRRFLTYIFWKSTRFCV